jgi:hypothetical protein
MSRRGPPENEVGSLLTPSASSLAVIGGRIHNNPTANSIFTVLNQNLVNDTFELLRVRVKTKKRIY